MVTCIFLAYGIYGGKEYLRLKEMEIQNKKLRQKIEQMKDENLQMMREIKALKTDPKMIEKIAREELGMVKPGEIKITTAKPDAKPASSMAQDSKAAPSSSR